MTHPLESRTMLASRTADDLIRHPGTLDPSRAAALFTDRPSRIERRGARCPSDNQRSSGSKN